MNPYIYIGIDCATTTGIAIYIPSLNVGKVVQYRGEPVQQLGFIKENCINPYLTLPKVFILEKPVHFKNANTVRSLNQRYGYIKYSLMDLNYLPLELNLNSVRSYLGCKTKGDIKHYFLPQYRGKKTFTDNHSDALALCVYQAAQDGYQFNPLDLVITDLEIK